MKPGLCLWLSNLVLYIYSICALRVEAQLNDDRDGNRLIGAMDFLPLFGPSFSSENCLNGK